MIRVGIETSVLKTDDAYNAALTKAVKKAIGEVLSNNGDGNQEVAVEVREAEQPKFQ